MPRKTQGLCRNIFIASQCCPRPRLLKLPTVTFSNLSTLESVFKSFRFHGKRYIVFVCTGHENATKCLRFHISVMEQIWKINNIYPAEKQF